MKLGRVIQAGMLLLGLACAEPEDSRPLLAGKNVLVTLIDACAAEHLQPYGYARATSPFLARLAEESVLFEDANAAAPYTLASVASLFTGESVDRHGVLEAGQVLPLDLPLWSEAFARAGYTTLGLSTNAHIRAQHGFARGFDSFETFAPRIDGAGLLHTIPPALQERLASFFETQAGLAEAHPFFAYVHLMPPHAPYAPPLEFRERLGAAQTDPRLGSIETLLPLSYGERLPDAAKAQGILDLYDAGVAYADAALAQIGAALQRTGLDQETLWIVLSDHGEAFGEHGTWMHSRHVHRELVHVPLLLRLPGGAFAGRRVGAAVGLVDLFPTLAELCGLPGPYPSAGSSLVPLLKGDPWTRGAPLVARTAGERPGLLLRAERWSLVVAPEGRAQLFDLSTDPGEQMDLAAQLPEQRRRLREVLDRQREQWHAQAQAPAERVEIDAQLREELEKLGYVDGPALLPGSSGQDGDGR